MVQGLAFLSKKGFNPQNNHNRKNVWEAQQSKENNIKRQRERNDQLKRERDDEELARAREGSRGGNQAALRFMYDAPPGLPPTASADTSTLEKELKKTPNSETQDFTQRQPGDDDAAAAFRAMLTAATAGSTGAEEHASDIEAVAASKDNTDSINGGCLAGSTLEVAYKGNENLSALEKMVGRKDANTSLTLEEQIARFPQLKNAPMAVGMNATNVGVSFKPLGTQIRNVRCLVCGVWGHSRGDRECEISGWNPFASKTGKSSASASSIMGPPQKNQSVPLEAKEELKEKERKPRREKVSNFSSDSGSSSSESRKKRSKKHKSSSRHGRKEPKYRRRSRSPSPEDRTSRKKKSHKRNRKY